MANRADPSDRERVHPPIRNGPRTRALLALAALAAAGVAAWRPEMAWGAAVFVLDSLVSVAPLVGPGILVAAWVAASGVGDHFAGALRGSGAFALIGAAAVGALTPVCGVTVLPLMAGLLASGVPLAPVMAFWLSSPITDPAMLAATAATLGIEFAVGKTVAAFGLGLFGGVVTALLARRRWIVAPLRSNRIVGALGGRTCGAPAGFDPAIWRDAGRRRRFLSEVRGLVRLILICLVPAFAAEYALNAVLQPDAVSAYVGTDAWWAIPLAVFVGGPAYIDGYAALPLTRALLDNGMSPGAAMAFLVSGGVVSIWGAMAIAPVLKTKPFLLFLALALGGSLLAGWGFALVA